jgi:23S rRNA (cytidine1920-2'-O)/16S rRNA (cytidine1409-2'-O)-methyltransferase
MNTEKKRIDVLLVEKKLASSREQAKKMVMAGCVYMNNQKVSKPSQIALISDAFEVKNFKKEFVSRGGYKLKKAIETFNIILQDKIAADIGASTGGFTDCMLQNGVKKVFAVDSGYGQLDWKLRSDDRVVSLERCNARLLEKETFGQRVDFVSIDVSFISVRLIFPALINILKENADIVCLIKPQFEAGREKVGKKGVVREKSTHIDVIMNVISYAKDHSFSVLGLSYSPIKGPNGNIEYLIYLSNYQQEKLYNIDDVVNTAWTCL